MKLGTSRRLATLAYLVAGALWLGCSADAETATVAPAAPSTEPTPEVEETEEESGDDDAGSVADASKPRDAGKKKDASTTQPDATVVLPPPQPLDSGKSDGSTTPAACNTVPVAAVWPVAVTGSAPSLTGGTLTDGEYKLVDYKRYISGTSNTSFPAFSMGLSIQGATLNLAGSGGRATYTFTASGNDLTLTRSCPSATTATWEYHVAGDMLTLYGVPPSNGTWYATFKRTP